MKKVLIPIVLGTLIAVAIVIGVKFTKSEKKCLANDDYLRIHIRANSNEEKDQSIKLKIKEKVVEYLTPFIAESKTQKQAKNVVRNYLTEIEEIANQTLKANGFDYSSKAEIRTEMFPTRTYNNFTLEKGCYEALILELGTGKGDNWWCVMFPPLCFVGGENSNKNGIEYKSKIWEIIKKYF